MDYVAITAWLFLGINSLSVFVEKDISVSHFTIFFLPSDDSSAAGLMSQFTTPGIRSKLLHYFDSRRRQGNLLAAMCLHVLLRPTSPHALMKDDMTSHSSHDGPTPVQEFSSKSSLTPTTPRELYVFSSLFTTLDWKENKQCEKMQRSH